jgi:hypothetical protein
VGLHTLLLLRHATPKPSTNGICHERGTAAYGATLHYEPFDTLGGTKSLSLVVFGRGVECPGGAGSNS